jgi:Protein of unknown function (DUF3631)/Domain of unknown function (DUF3854)
LDSLNESDLALFRRLGITNELVGRAGVRCVTDREARELLGTSHPGDLAGLFFPYLDPISGRRVSGRLRRDHPEIGPDGKPARKYICGFGDTRHLYFPPGAGPLLSDPSVSATFVEAEKSVLAVAALMERLRKKALVIGTGGCWGWRGKTGINSDANGGGGRDETRGPLPDLDRVTWTARKVGLVFDSNVTSNPKVRAAREALARELTRRGAKVFLVDLPEERDVNGPDDFIVAHGDDDFIKLLKSGHLFGQRKMLGRNALDSALTFVRRFVSLSDAQALVVILWVAHTHAFGAADCTAYLDVNSPEKGSGKTRLLEVVKLLVARPWFTGRVSAAVLVRKIDAAEPTLLLDESDAAFSSDQDYAEALRGVLNTGYRRGGAASLCVGQGSGITFKDFSTFSPKAIAGIGSLPDTVRDRSIPIRLKRARRGQVERFREREAEREGRIIAEKLSAWCAARLEGLRGATPAIPGELTDRQADCCEPLLAIADAAGGEWPQRARRSLVELCAGAQFDDRSVGVMLLSDVRHVFHPRDEQGNASPALERITSADLVKALCDMEDRPWPEWGKGQKPLTQPALAHLLARYDIRTRNIRFPDRVLKGYEREAFDEAWGLYLPPDSPSPPLQTATAATTRMNTGENGDFATATAKPCSGPKNEASASEDAACSGVAAENQENPVEVTFSPGEEEVTL